MTTATKTTSIRATSDRIERWRLAAGREGLRIGALLSLPEWICATLDARADVLLRTAAEWPAIKPAASATRKGRK